MVDVEEGGLGALEEDLFAAREDFVQNDARIGHIGAQFLGVCQVFLQHGVVVERLAAVDFGNDVIFGLDVDGQFFREDLGIHEIADTDAHTGHFIHVARADAAFGRADLGLAQGFFLEFVQALMVRQDHVSTVADGDAADVDALVMHFLDFLQDNAGVDDDAVAEDADLAVVQDARRQQAQLIRHIVNDYRMARVGPAGITNHGVRLLGQIIHDFPFSFVAPLGTDDNNR